MVFIRDPHTVLFHISFLMIRHQPTSNIFHNTTLFRSATEQIPGPSCAPSCVQECFRKDVSTPTQHYTPERMSNGLQARGEAGAEAGGGGEQNGGEAGWGRVGEGGGRAAER